MRAVLMAAPRAFSGITFNPVPGPYSRSRKTVVSFTVDASAPVVWNWSSTGDLPTANVANGGTASSITFTLNKGVGPDKSTDITLTVGASTWTIALDATGAGVLGP